MTREECIQEFIKIIDSKLEDVPFNAADEINAKEKWLDLEIFNGQDKCEVTLSKLFYNDDSSIVRQFSISYYSVITKEIVTIINFYFIDDFLEELLIEKPQTDDVYNITSKEEQNKELENILQELKTYNIVKVCQ